MLTRLEIDGFKTFENLCVDLSPFTAIVGNNAAGKSNLFDVIQLLSNLATKDVAEAVKEMRGEPLELFRQTEAGRSRQIRLAAEEHESRPDGPFEILTLAGSPSRDGARLHMAVANASDDVTGGHACYGCTVRTTAEAPVVRLDRGALERELGQAIGLKAMAARNL